MYKWPLNSLVLLMLERHHYFLKITYLIISSDSFYNKETIQMTDMAQRSELISSVIYLKLALFLRLEAVVALCNCSTSF